MDPELKAYLDEWRSSSDGRWAELDEWRVSLDEWRARVDARFDEYDRRFDLVAEALVRIEHRLERARIA